MQVPDVEYDKGTVYCGNACWGSATVLNVETEGAGPYYVNEEQDDKAWLDIGAMAKDR